MMAFIIILLLNTLQFAMGFGLTGICRLTLKPALLLPLAMLLGVAAFSFIPFLMQLLYIPLTGFSVFGMLVTLTILCNLPLTGVIARYRKVFSAARFRVRLYEVPFFTVIAIIVFVSVWRCFYMPPTPRDFTSGAEAIAEYAVREKTMINSVFSVNMESTNNPFKPPFATCLQIIYKLAGFHFGQLWLGSIFISFIIFLYHALNRTLHRIISGLLLVAFIAIPEMFAYTFMVLFDYSNAVYFFLGVYFLAAWCSSRQYSQLVFAGIMMGIATYTRNETLALVVCMLPLLLLCCMQHKAGWVKAVTRMFVYIIPSIIVYVLCVTIYLNHYLPVKYNVSELINPHLTNIRPLLKRFADINTVLIFSKNGIVYYSYFIFLFLALFIAELLINRAIKINAANWLYAVLVVYAGLAILGFLLPLMDLENTTKRGLFKIFPLMLLYMANNKLLIQASRYLAKWEQAETLS